MAHQLTVVLLVLSHFGITTMVDAACQAPSQSLDQKPHAANCKGTNYPLRYNTLELLFNQGGKTGYPINLADPSIWEIDIRANGTLAGSETYTTVEINTNRSSKIFR